MSAAPCVNNTNPISQNGKDFMPHTPKLEEIIRKVRSLRSLTKTTGFYTTRSIGVLLAGLSPDELVEVSEALELTPREMPHR